MNTTLLNQHYAEVIKEESQSILKKIFSMMIIIVLLSCSSYTNAQNYPSGFSQQLVSGNIGNATCMAFAPDGRIFVAQQTGQLRIVKNGSLLSDPFISLNVNSNGERGLLGIAFDPSFNANKYIYLYYTVSSGANNRISRFTANGDVVQSGSEVVILNLDPLSSATSHNGGTMQFGPDGKLYIGVGENTNGANAQNLDTYLGKVLRINPDGSVPSGNPFPTGSAQRQRVWAYGLRNPYTLTFQPGTGKLFVNDVGQSAWEEINDATTGGANFGWPSAEGTSTNTAYKNPVYAYAHGSASGQGCAITGGTFFNPASTNYPSTYAGKYFFIDYCGNWIDVLSLNGSSGSRSGFASNTGNSIVSIVTGPDGNLYFLSRTNSSLYKIVYSGSSGTEVLTPVADAFVRGGTASTQNFGKNKSLNIRNASSNANDERVFLRFNISTLSANLPSVKLRLYGSLSNTNNASVVAQVFNVPSHAWGEQTITFDNRPSASATAIASTTISGTTDKYYEWDLTAHINSLRSSGASFVSLTISNFTISNNTRAVFYARENATNKPELRATTGTLVRLGDEFQETTIADKEEQNLIPSMTVYPNPVQEFLTARFNSTFEKGTLQLFDMTGKIIREMTIAEIMEQTMEVGDLKNGVYILVADDGTSKVSRRVIISK